jgi:hypothetical protein
MKKYTREQILKEKPSSSQIFIRNDGGFNSLKEDCKYKIDSYVAELDIIYLIKV